MELEVYLVDAFTDEPYKGNPAGVCITDESVDVDLALSIAAEMAVSETAYLSLQDMSLRWFTPQVEVKLCGHGTLAVAHVLREKNLAPVGGNVVFKTISGPLSAQINESTVELDFPAPVLTPSSADDQLLKFLGIPTSHVVTSSGFDEKHLFEIDSEELLLELKPNFDQLLRLQGRGVVVTVKAASAGRDFVSRYFAPWVGVNEDPVTGSAHCALALYWSKKFKKAELVGYQASSRGGYVTTEVLGDNRVKLTGSAVTISKRITQCG